VATPGNRSRQRLATSGRSYGDSGETAGGEDTGEDDDDCAGERRNLDQAMALANLYMYQHAECRNTDPRAPLGSVEDCTGGQLILSGAEQIMEYERLLESYREALRLYEECMNRE
jgi:hypothetical protein